ncbi:MAG TPA: hypothetical protein DCY79_09490 [Planctomycetaceae bacterium]|nr:hypothetical protein [Blastopirellula sp.]HAY80021.1 hypothetical protein [Planctomycetaceae bacterium]
MDRSQQALCVRRFAPSAGDRACGSPPLQARIESLDRSDGVRDLIEAAQRKRADIQLHADPFHRGTILWLP